MNSAQNNSLNSIRYELLHRDKWDATEIGLTPHYSRSDYKLSFNRIAQPWFKLAAKQFILLQAATKSFSSCRSYILALTYFSEFLDQTNQGLNPSCVNRSLIIDFIQHLSVKKLSSSTRGITFIHLRTFHRVCLQEDWLPWPERTLIYPEDIPKSDVTLPRYIPDYVIKQLKCHLNHLPAYKQRLITILLETGRRIGEICALPFSCLEQDPQGDWYLRVHEQKMKKTRLIPVSAACRQAIQLQQTFISEKVKDSTYLFPSPRPKFSRSPYVIGPDINKSLQKLAIKYKILDDSGRLWHFHCHQFRHTVGTNMINSGVPQIMVQQYLGHESPRMTDRYAHIHNETLKKEFLKYQNRLINIQGNETVLEAQWMKNNLASQVLPNGLCALPLTQKRCPHANACLTCANFRTNKKYIPEHKAQLKETIHLIETAKEKKWPRIVEMNKEVANNLTKIINTLEKEHNE